MAIKSLYPAYFILIMMTMLWSCNQEKIIIKGIEYNMATERKTRVKDLRYDLHFIIPKDKDVPIASNMKISFELQDNKKHLVLDFKEDSENLISLEVNGQLILTSIINEHIIVPANNLNSGQNNINIEFTAGNLSLNRSEDYLYTLLVPARARTVFPVFDQPDLKATYSLSLDIPVEWEGVSNGPIIEERNTNGRKKLKFGKTKPISTYLFAFAVGNFHKWTDTETGMTMYYRESDSTKVARNAPEIFRLHQASLDWLETYTGISYPFQKFDFALIPTFQYGGMEHPGSIFYRERSLMLDESASVNQKLSRASLIAHETAHMWFGDLVTMKWFDDVWLKEVFANFMAAKIVHPSFPEINHDLRFLLAHYPSAYSIDRTPGSHPIQQKLLNLEDAGSVYGAIIYQKAPIVMRKLENILGHEEFQYGIQEYLKTFSFDNATWDDLIEIMSSRTTTNLQQWNTDWVKKQGMPILSLSIKQSTMLQVKIDNDHGERKWPQFLQIKAITPEGDSSINAHTQEWDSGIAIPSSTNILYPNPDGRTYAYHMLDSQQLEYLLSNIKNVSSAVERASIWIMLWESYLNGEVDRNSIIETLAQQLADENNPLILSYITGLSRTLYWNFSSSGQRNSIASGLESIVLTRLLEEKDISIQRTLFQFYTSIASTFQAVENLKSMWRKTFPELPLKLSDRDYESLAYALALRLPNESESILTSQMDSLSNPDSKKRMAFLIPSLSPSVEVRDSVFESLKNVDNRNIEPWVGQALSFLHHPLRNESSLHYILPGLELLEEIQETGDIFFPKRWLDNTLGGHSSSAAADIVRKFLNNHKELPDHLKNKVLQSSDLLFRASLQN